jgi:hypothetical protein
MSIESAGDGAEHNYGEFPEYQIPEEPPFEKEEPHELLMYDVKLPIVGDKYAIQPPDLYRKTLHVEPRDLGYLDRRPYEQTSREPDSYELSEMMGRLPYDPLLASENLQARYPELFDREKEPKVQPEFSRIAEIMQVGTIRYAFDHDLTERPTQDDEGGEGGAETPLTPTENSYPSPHFQRHDDIPVEGDE